jgi:hypothetical protein
MSATGITHLVDRAVFDAQADIIAFMATIDATAAEFKSDDELLWRRKLALEIIHLRERLNRV